MRKIILVLLLLALLPVGLVAAPARSKIVMVKVLCNPATLGVHNDAMYRQAAAVRQICANRGIEVDEYNWDGRDMVKWRRLLRNMGDTWNSTRTGSARDYELAVIVGGRSGYAINTTEDYPGASAQTDTIGGYIRKLWEPDSTLISELPTIVWFADCNFGEITGATKYYNCGLWRTDEVATHRLALEANTSRWWAFHTQSAHTDTFWQYMTHDGLTSGGGEGDGATAIDTILTSANYPTSANKNYRGHLSVWSRTGAIGQPFYYVGLRDGSVNNIVDALICKHVTNFTPLAFTIDIDDFGLVGSTLGTPSDARYWNNIDSLFTVIDRYDMVLNVGATADNVRTTYEATSYWKKWQAIAARWKDNPAIRWTPHDHGNANTADSVTMFFAGQNGTLLSPYNDYFGSPSGTVTTAIIDTLYDAAVDSLAALYGVACDNYIIPYMDDVNGVKNDLQDTIADWLASRGMSCRSVYNEATTDLYKDTQWYRGAKFLNGIYLSASTDTLRLLYADGASIKGKAQMLWLRMLGPMFYLGSTMTGTNPQQAAPGAITWSNYAGYGLYKYEYGPRVDGRVLVMHMGACYTSVPGAEARNVSLIKELGQMIRYLEELAGKDIYRCVSGEELATKWWEQVR